MRGKSLTLCIEEMEKMTARPNDIIRTRPRKRCARLRSRRSMRESKVHRESREDVDYNDETIGYLSHRSGRIMKITKKDEGLRISSLVNRNFNRPYLKSQSNSNNSSFAKFRKFRDREISRLLEKDACESETSGSDGDDEMF
mmetsp:Transcript_3924/g.5628  ORF Transcript_3924/g.5628 Transcript_3924/m.5628 type:complete len:142 (+) Transcript_3924:3-428(+)